MKKSIVIKWLSIAVLSLCFALSIYGFCYGVLSKNTVVNAQTATYTTASALGIDTLTPINAEDEAAFGASDVFYMEKGAAVRADVTKPGVKFIAYVSNNFVTPSGATDEFYVMFTVTKQDGTTGSLFVPVTKPILNDDKNDTIEASVTFDGVSGENFDSYKALEISGRALIIREDIDGEKTVILATENDNTRTMELVVNSAKLAGSIDEQDTELVKVMNDFVPEHANYIQTERVYMEKTSTDLETVAYAYINNKKTAIADIEAGFKGDVILRYTSGEFANMPFFMADKVIRTASDLDYITTPTLTDGQTTVGGYVVVANDIGYTTSSTVNYPEYTRGTYKKSDGNYYFKCYDYGFTGTFDGDGHNVKFIIRNGGLFGSLLSGSTVKNVVFTVKNGDNVPANEYKYLEGRNVILARWGKQFVLENVYAQYDKDTSIVDLSYATGGIGLFATSSEGTLTNVVVDLSNINGNEKIEKWYKTSDITSSVGNSSYYTRFDNSSDGRNYYGFGALICNPIDSWYMATMENTFVVWDREEIFLVPKTKKLAVAENDYAEFEANNKITDEKYTHGVYGECTISKYTGVNRYSTLADMYNAGATTVGDFNIVKSGEGEATTYSVEWSK